MSDRTVKKFAGLSIATVAFVAAALPLSGLLSQQAIGGEMAAETTGDGAVPPATAPAGDAHAAHGASAAAVDPARIAKGRDLFTNWSCNSCHTLADAKASGAVGPSLDGDTGLSEELVTSRVTNGQGAMPSFGGQLSKEEVADLAYYVTHAAAK